MCACILIQFHQHNLLMCVYVIGALFNQCLMFSLWRSFTSLVTFIPKYFFFLVAIINGISFLLLLKIPPIMLNKRVKVHVIVVFQI